MNTRIFGAAAIVLMAAASSASADFVQLRDAPGGEHANGFPGGPLLVGTGSTLNGTFSNGSDGPMYVGTWDLEADFGGGFQSLITYCIEPNAPITFGFHPDDLVGVQYETAPIANADFTATEAAHLGILWANAFADSLTSALKSAAFQSILWEWSEDDSVDLVNGNFRLNPASDYSDDVRAQAQIWVDNITSGTWTSSIELTRLTNDESQDYVFSVIPSPGALALLGLSGLVGCGRRRPS